MRRPYAALVLALLLPALAGVAPAGAIGPGAAAKIRPALRAELAMAPDGRAEMLVVLAEQADLAPARLLRSKQEKGRFVHDALTAVARRTQAPLLAELDRRGLERRSFWIANFVWTRGDLALAETLAQRADVARIDANPRLAVLPPEIAAAGESPSAVEWNIAWVNADDVWALGYTGQGAVVGGQDTGYLWSHAALVDHYRGWNGSSADHNYNWHDSIHSGGGSCGADSPFPCDDHGHGTHTMGTMVGDDGGSNQVGMAPGAKWIGCRNMDVGNGTPATYSECFQWFIAPTDLSNSNPDPAKAPDVINNSWGCPPSEGCTTPDILRTVVENTRAAGIFVAVSAGNSGSSCSTVTDPAAIYDASFSVGATDSGDGIAGFSSRGPVTVDGSGRLKPDISAPGVNIRSSTRDGGYQGGWSGTSMAGPHVAGLVALLISANPGLAGDVDTLEQVIRDSAVHPMTSTQVCGGIPATVFPNNTFGDGRIDALAAVNLALSIDGYTLDAMPPSRAVCTPEDAVYDLTLAQQGSFAEPVTLSVSGAPAGATTGFSVNPVTPPGVSTLTVGTGGALTGSTMTVTGISSPSGIERSTEVTLDLYISLPGSPGLTSPALGATNVDLLPTFEWSVAIQGREYLLEVDDDPAFSSIDYSAQLVDETTHTATAPLAPETLYHWRVRTMNPCGEGGISSVFTFTTRGIPPVLLVDDDDNGPDVRPTYTAALDALGVAYDVWDTANSDDEPSAGELAPYSRVVWFSGDEFGGFAGPGAAGEAALATYLDAGGCLLLSSQDYHFDRGLTAFMTNYLGASAITDDNGNYTSVSGGVGSLFEGLGPYPLSYPFSDFSDVVTPDATSMLSMQGNNSNGAGVEETALGYTSIFFAFPWEAIAAAGDRETVLQTALDACAAGPSTWTLDAAVTGSGTVTSVPAGINCPGDCTEDYASGTMVALTPTPASGWMFAGWSGDCTGTGACNVSMTQDRSVAATFVEITWTLDVSVTGPGTVTSSPAGIDCPGDCTEDYVDGTPVGLSATPAAGAFFVGWSGDCSGAGACDLTMSADHSVAAGFDTMPFADGFESGDTSAWTDTVP